MLAPQAMVCSASHSAAAFWHAGERLVRARKGAVTSIHTYMHACEATRAHDANPQLHCLPRSLTYQPTSLPAYLPLPRPPIHPRLDISSQKFPTLRFALTPHGRMQYAIPHAYATQRMAIGALERATHPASQPTCRPARQQQRARKRCTYAAQRGDENARSGPRSSISGPRRSKTARTRTCEKGRDGTRDRPSTMTTTPGHGRVHRVVGGGWVGRLHANVAYMSCDVQFFFSFPFFTWILSISYTASSTKAREQAENGWGSDERADGSTGFYRAMSMEGDVSPTRANGTQSRGTSQSVLRNGMEDSSERQV
ncbi:hypothetical protein BS50DRAFT_31994 [Corynespora cassiicola Philippines]|uniref:Uncharacterized protein n=1 Tax=Corynespora cassiicola Philippines TaxID=1448308 RepID=A0A2T2PC00_CORCC|nr:hypothetical protein BS50DRAFT_31994 [Corynespora cassiicola Philippines]